MLRDKTQPATEGRISPDPSKGWPSPSGQLQWHLPGVYCPHLIVRTRVYTFPNEAQLLPQCPSPTTVIAPPLRSQILAWAHIELEASCPCRPLLIVSLGPWVQPLVVEPAVNLTPPPCAVSLLWKETLKLRRLSIDRDARVTILLWCSEPSLLLGTCPPCATEAPWVSLPCTHLLGQRLPPCRVSDVVKAHPQGLFFETVSCPEAGSQWP